MDGLVQVLALSLFTILARGDGCTMVQDFNADVIFNQSSHLPSPLKQLHVRNSKICNSKCCSLDGCNVVYFNNSSSTEFSCVMYSCHPTSACGFDSKQGIQVFVNEVDLPSNSYDSVTPNVSSTVEKTSDTTPIPFTQEVSNETPLSYMIINGTTNTSPSSKQVSKSTTPSSNDSISESYETDTNGTTNTSRSLVQIPPSTTTASNDSTSEPIEADTKGTANAAALSSPMSTLNTTPSNYRTLESSQTDIVGEGNIVSQSQQISTSIAAKNDTSVPHIDADGLDSTFRPSSSSAFANQIFQTHILSSSLSENFKHFTSISNPENSSYTANNNDIQPSKTTHQSPKLVSSTSLSTNASSTLTSQNVTTLLSSLVPTLPSTKVPSSGDTDSHVPIFPTSTAMLDASKELITNSLGSSDQMESTSTTYHVTMEHQANELTQVTSSSLLSSFDISRYTGNSVTTEIPIAPTTSSNVMTASRAVVESPLNGTEASLSTSGMPDVLKTLLLCSLAFGCIFILAVVGVLGKLVFDSYRKRHYSRLDYLINGMY